MCSAPVSTITELGPMTGRIGEFPAADGATSGGAVKTVLTASGPLTMTSFMPLGQKVSVKDSPRRSAQLSMTHVGATAQASVCSSDGARGPGGRPRRAPTERAGAAGAALGPAGLRVDGAGRRRGRGGVGLRRRDGRAGGHAAQASARRRESQRRSRRGVLC